MVYSKDKLTKSLNEMQDPAFIIETKEGLDSLTAFRECIFDVSEGDRASAYDVLFHQNFDSLYACIYETLFARLTSLGHMFVDMNYIVYITTQDDTLRRRIFVVDMLKKKLEIINEVSMQLITTSEKITTQLTSSKRFLCALALFLDDYGRQVLGNLAEYRIFSLQILKILDKLSLSSDLDKYVWCEARMFETLLRFMNVSYYYWGHTNDVFDILCRTAMVRQLESLNLEDILEQHKNDILACANVLDTREPDLCRRKFEMTKEDGSKVQYKVAIINTYKGTRLDTVLNTLLPFAMNEKNKLIIYDRLKKALRIFILKGNEIEKLCAVNILLTMHLTVPKVYDEVSRDFDLTLEIDNVGRRSEASFTFKSLKSKCSLFTADLNTRKSYPDTWSMERVKQWFIDNKISMELFEALNPCTGLILKELYDMHRNNLTLYHRTLKRVLPKDENTPLLLAQKLKILFF